MFFVKSHEWNFSYRVEMVQSIHVQYIIKYFIKCCNYFESLLKYIALCNTLVQGLVFHKCNI